MDYCVHWYGILTNEDIERYTGYVSIGIQDRCSLMNEDSERYM